jgi:hypothetical protein
MEMKFALVLNPVNTNSVWRVAAQMAESDHNEFKTLSEFTSAGLICGLGKEDRGIISTIHNKTLVVMNFDWYLKVRDRQQIEMIFYSIYKFGRITRDYGNGVHREYTGIQMNFVAGMSETVYKKLLKKGDLLVHICKIYP